MKYHIICWFTANCNFNFFLLFQKNHIVFYLNTIFVWQDLCISAKKITTFMKKAIVGFTILLLSAFIITSCSTSKNGTNLKPTNSNLAGKWTISNIAVNVPEGFKVTNVFDEAPYSDFQGSTWDLVRNGNGSFTLQNGKKENIYWSIYGKGNNAQFQFKKLNGEKARNVEDGYRLQLGPISSNSFTATSSVNTVADSTGTITYTFTKQ